MWFKRLVPVLKHQVFYYAALCLFQNSLMMQVAQSTETS